MRRAGILASALLLALLAGCGEGDDEHADGHEDPEGNTTQTTAPTSADGTEPTGGGTETSAADDGAGHAHDSATFPPSDATDTIKLSMRDHAFVDMPATVTGPRVRLEAKNNGPSEHEILIFDADGNEIAGTRPVPPGETAVLSAELPSGTYQLRCLVELSATETHFDRGMRVTFAVM